MYFFVSDRAEIQFNRFCFVRIPGGTKKCGSVTHTGCRGGRLSPHTTDRQLPHHTRHGGHRPNKVLGNGSELHADAPGGNLKVCSGENPLSTDCPASSESIPTGNVFPQYRMNDTGCPSDCQATAERSVLPEVVCRQSVTEQTSLNHRTDKRHGRTDVFPQRSSSLVRR